MDTGLYVAVQLHTMRRRGLGLVNLQLPQGSGWSTIPAGLCSIFHWASAAPTASFAWLDRWSEASPTKIH